MKSISEFPGKSQICKSCSNPTPTVDLINAKVITVAVTVAVIIVISVFLLFRGGNSIAPTSERDTITVLGNNDSQSDSNEDKVDAALFNSCLEREDYLGAFDAIDGKSDSENYKEPLKSEVERYLWHMLEVPQQTDNLTSFFLANKRLIDALGLDLNQWKNYANACTQLKSLISKKTLAAGEKVQAEKLIAGLPDSDLKNSFKDKITSKLNEKQNPNDNHAAVSRDSYLILSDTKGKQDEKITGTRGFDYSEGIKVTIKSPTKRLSFRGAGIEHAKYTGNNKREVVIDVKNGVKVIVSDGNIEVTITGKPNFIKA